MLFGQEIICRSGSCRIWIVTLFLTALSTIPSVCDAECAHIHVKRNEEFSFTSPNYPYDYDNDQYACWTVTFDQRIQNIQGSNYKYYDAIQLNLRTLHLEEGSADDLCDRDAVIVRDGTSPYSQIIRSYCGQLAEVEIPSVPSFKGLHVTFRSDESVTRPGFDAYVNVKALRLKPANYYENEPDNGASDWVFGVIIGSTTLLLAIVGVAIGCVKRYYRDR